jgi:hypothetical protein
VGSLIGPAITATLNGVLGAQTLILVTALMLQLSPLCLRWFPQAASLAAVEEEEIAPSAAGDVKERVPGEMRAWARRSDLIDLLPL